MHTKVNQKVSPEIRLIVNLSANLKVSRRESLKASRRANQKASLGVNPTTKTGAEAGATRNLRAGVRDRRVTTAAKETTVMKKVSPREKRRATDVL